MSLNLALLGALVDLAHWSVPVATLLAATFGTVLRYLANDRFVFGHPQPAWARFFAYGVATSGSVCVGYAVVNTLAWLGLHYLFAALATTACSVILHFVSNFLWVWRPAKTDPAPAPSLRTVEGDLPAGISDPGS
jgi:putative flippase GtrA